MSTHGCFRVTLLGMLLLMVMVMLIGCGGSNSSRTTSSPSPSPGTTTPSPSPSPTPTPTPSSAPDSYLATIICCSVGKSQSAEGQLTLDTAANNGAGNVQIVSDGAVPPNENMTLQFCPFPQNFTNCLNVASLATDSHGNANVNFTFPQKGTFAGVFQFVANGNQVLVTAAASTSGVNFKSAELPAATVTGGIGQTTGNAPGSGTIVVTGSTPHLVLSNTFPNHTFQVSACGVSGNCGTASSVTTDGQGNASADIGALQPFNSNIFVVKDSSGVQFISAFRVQ